MAATTAAKARAAFARQVAKINGRQTVIPPGEAALMAHPRAAAALLGRLGRDGAPVTGPGQGNTVVTSDERGAPAAQPGKGAGGGIADASPYPQRVIVTPASQLLLRARTPGYQNGRLIARDRHITTYRGRTMSSGSHQATGGTPNPDADGPPQPAYRMLNRTLSWQIGTDSTAFLDNGGPHSTTRAGGRAYPLGTQGDPYSRVYGGTPGLARWRPYGKRGGPGPGAPAPTVVAMPGGPYRPGTVLATGDPGDGPQKIYGGLPWGLHSPTPPPVQLTQGTQRVRFVQVRPPQMNRPLNSKIAGQSYSQTVVHLDGTQAVKVPRMPGGRQPGLNYRWRRS
jgi:hypothetical protein